MLTNKTLRWTGFLLIVFALAAGVSPFAQAQPTSGGTIIEAMGTEPTNLDIFKAARRPEYTVLHLIFEPLFIVDADLKIQPHLVESYTVSADQKTWTFKIKKGITFHDGTALNAEAVKFSLDKHIAGSQGRFLTIIDSVTVADPMTVTIKLKQSYALLLNALSSPNIVIASPTAYNKSPDEWGSKVLVGTGPMMFKEWHSGDRVVMAKNPDYRHGPAFLKNRGPALVDGWEIRFLPEATTLIAELTAGDVDLSDYVTERDVKKVQRSKQHTNSSRPSRPQPSTWP